MNLDYGINPDTGKQVKKTQTADKLTQARAVLRKHETARDTGQSVIPKNITLAQCINTWIENTVKLNL